MWTQIFDDDYIDSGGAIDAVGTGLARTGDPEIFSTAAPVAPATTALVHEPPRKSFRIAITFVALTFDLLQRLIVPSAKEIVVLPGWLLKY